MQLSHDWLGLPTIAITSTNELQWLQSIARNQSSPMNTFWANVQPIRQLKDSSTHTALSVGIIWAIKSRILFE